MTAGGATRAVSSAPGLYLHIPFCSAICPYCDFSVLTGGTKRRGAFSIALRRELGLWSNSEWPAAFDTIYFGGGTPSLLSTDRLAEILSEAKDSLEFAASPWIQFEANPEDVDHPRVESWRRLGINSLSLGIQSFDDAALRFLGRRHSGKEARRAVGIALAAGFDSVSIDLIFGLPNQTLEDWRRDLDQAVSLAPHHISCYQLTIHGGTPFGFRRDRGHLAEMPNDRQADLFRQTHRRLADHGYEAYEVSNFARRDGSDQTENRSRHNQKYWQRTPYLGVGPSAHSFDGQRRWWNERKLPSWAARLEREELPIASFEQLGDEESLLETLMLGLRTVQGVDLAQLDRRFGTNLALSNRMTIERMTHAGLIHFDGSILRPTLEGLAVADSLVTSLEMGRTTIS